MISLDATCSSVEISTCFQSEARQWKTELLEYINQKQVSIDLISNQVLNHPETIYNFWIKTRVFQAIAQNTEKRWAEK